MTSILPDLQRRLDAGGDVALLEPGVHFVDGTLFIGSDTHLRLGPETVLSLAPKVNAPLMRTRPTAGRHRNIAISGGTLDYAGARQSTRGGTLDTMAVILERVDGVRLRDCRGVDAKKYIFLLADCSDVEATGLRFDTPSDGIHFQGPGRNITVRDVGGRTGDDMIAFTIGDYSSYELSRGDFENIVVEDVRLEGAKTGVKLAGNPGFGFRNVAVRRMAGEAKDYGVIVLIDRDLDATIVEDLVIEGLDVRSLSGKAAIYVGQGCSIDTLTVRDFTAHPGPEEDRGYAAMRLQPEARVRDLVLERARSDTSVPILASARGVFGSVRVADCDFSGFRFGLRLESPSVRVEFTGEHQASMGADVDYFVKA